MKDKRCRVGIDTVGMDTAIAVYGMGCSSELNRGQFFTYFGVLLRAEGGVVVRLGYDR